MIPRGRDGVFDKDIIMPASTVVTHGDKHWLYYGGANERHGTDKVRMPRKHAIGLATLRLDGFVCLKARTKEGVQVTKPFRLGGNTLEINIGANRRVYAPWGELEGTKENRNRQLLSNYSIWFWSN